MAALLETLLAYTALEGSHIRVCPHMLLQVYRLAESFAAYNTPVRFYFGVYPQVLVEAGLLGEGLGAE